MLRTHGANYKSILFAQILDPYEVTLSEFPQIKRVLFVHVYKASVNNLTWANEMKICTFVSNTKWSLSTCCTYQKK